MNAIPQKTPLRENLAALFLIVAVLALVAIRLWAANEAVRFPGPSHIALGPEGLICVVVAGEVHTLDANGTRLNTVALADLAIDKIITDFQVSGDGDLLIGDADRGEIAKCDAATRSCEHIALPYHQAAAAPHRAFAFYWDDATETIYFSDTDQNRLFSTTLDGEPIAAAPVASKAPNELFVENGRLYVAETTGHRIAAYEIAERVIGDEAWALDVRSPVARPDRSRPLAMARVPDGSWWVINGNLLREHGDLVVYDGDGKGIERIALAAGADPSDLLSLGDRVLVPDQADFRLASYALDGTRQADFGDPDYQRWLTELRDRKARYEEVTSESLAILVLMVAAAALLYRRHQKRNPKETPSPTSEPEPAPVDGIHWIEPNAGKVRLILILLVVATVALVFTLILIFGVLSSTATTDKPLATGILPEVWLIILCLVAIQISVGYPLYCSVRSRIGTDGASIYLANHRGESVSAAPDRVLYNSKFLSIGEAAISLQTNRSFVLFPPEEVQKYIFSRLPTTSKLADRAMTMHLLRIRYPALIWPLATVAITIIAQAVLALAYPEVRDLLMR